MVDLDRLEDVLIGAAAQRRTVTYGELLRFFERRVTRITVGALCRDLGLIGARRAGEGWPDLACLVVRKTDRLPGEGYFAALREEGLYAGPSEGAEAQAALQLRQELAFGWAAERHAKERAAAAARPAAEVRPRPAGRSPRAAGRPS